MTRIVAPETRPPFSYQPTSRELLREITGARVAAPAILSPPEVEKVSYVDEAYQAPSIGVGPKVAMSFKRKKLGYQVLDEVPSQELAPSIGVTKRATAYQYSPIKLRRLVNYELASIAAYNERKKRAASYQFNIIGALRGIASNVQKTVVGAENWVAKTVQPAIKTASQTATAISQGLVVRGQQLVSGAEQVAGQVERFVAPIGGAVYNAAKTAYNDIAAGVQTAWNEVQGAMAQFSGKFNEALAALSAVTSKVNTATQQTGAIAQHATATLARINELETRAKLKPSVGKMEFEFELDSALLSFQAAAQRKGAVNVASRIAALRAQRAQTAALVQANATKIQAQVQRLGPVKQQLQNLLTQAQTKLSALRGKAAEVEAGRQKLLSTQRQANAQVAQAHAQLNARLGQAGKVAAQIPVTTKYVSPRGHGYGGMGYNRAALDQLVAMGKKSRKMSYEWQLLIIALVNILPVIILNWNGITGWITSQIEGWLGIGQQTNSSADQTTNDVSSQITTLQQQQDQLTTQLQQQDTEITDLQNQLAAVGGVQTGPTGQPTTYIDPTTGLPTTNPQVLPTDATGGNYLPGGTIVSPTDSSGYLPGGQVAYTPPQEQYPSSPLTGSDIAATPTDLTGATPATSVSPDVGAESGLLPSGEVATPEQFLPGGPTGIGAEAVSQPAAAAPAPAKAPPGGYIIVWPPTTEEEDYWAAVASGAG